MAKLYKRGKIYYGDLYIKGKRVRHALSSDRRFAEEKLADLVKTRQAEKYGDRIVNPSWDTFKTRYMAYSKTKKPQTHKHDLYAFDKLEKAFPLTRLETMHPRLLESFKEHLGKIINYKGRTNSVSSQNRDLRAIKAAINKAIEWGMLKNDPGYRHVRYYKEAKGRLDYFKVEEIQILMKACRGVWRTILMLGYYAGLRREEIYALRTSSLDFIRNRIHIEPYEGFTPKDYERRFVPMHPELRSYLEQTVKDQEFVLGKERPSLAVMSSYFSRLVREAGFKGRSLHTLRHTFGSQMAMSGVPLRKIQTWMGHSKISTTEIYSHLSQDHLDQDIEKLPCVHV